MNSTSFNYINIMKISMIVLTELIPKAYLIYFVWNLIEHKLTLEGSRTSFISIQPANDFVSKIFASREKSYEDDHENRGSKRTSYIFSDITPTEELLHPTILRIN